MNQFSKATEEALQYYVYRLIDPRDGQTFYVGKGKGNRVFDHAAQQMEISNDPDVGEDETSLKLQTIGEIRAAGLEVLHVVHRHPGRMRWRMLVQPSEDLGSAIKAGAKVRSRTDQRLARNADGIQAALQAAKKSELDLSI